MKTASARSAALTPAVPAAERGSAYLFALLVLLVLTVIGLSLAIVTQSEVQIGAAERTGVRVFYQSDSAMRVQLASLFFNDPQRRELRFADDLSVGTASLQDRVTASAFFPIFSGPCSLCAVNTGDRRYFSINHVVAARTRRSSVVGADETLYAEKTLSQMFAVQPMERSVEAFRTVENLNEIKY